MIKLMRFAILLVLCFLVCNIGFAYGKLVFSRSHPPSGWVISGRADSKAAVKFAFALKQQNLAELEDKFLAVSDPSSPYYRNFLSVNEIMNIVRSKAEDVFVVEEWLLNNGVSGNEIAMYPDSLEVQTSVAVAERLFQTTLYDFYHSAWDRTIIRQSGALSIPSNILHRIDLLLGLANFPHYRPDIHLKSVTDERKGSQSDIAITAQSVYSLYNLPSQILQNSSTIASQCVVEFASLDFLTSDLEDYSQMVGIPFPAPSPDHIIGHHEEYPQPYYIATVGLEIVSTVNTEAATWFWNEDDTTWLYGFSMHYFNLTEVPQVVACRSGWWEGDQCEAAFGGTECQMLGVTSAGYVQRINIEFQKIGLRGTSIIVGAGSSGTHTWYDLDCAAHTFYTDFPASSPWVTTVGTTQLNNPVPLATQPDICGTAGLQCAANGTEVAPTYEVSKLASGGGFSQLSVMPDYQTSAVQKYLSSGVKMPNPSYYNTSNRAIPDISSVGQNYLTYQSESGILVMAGTDASSKIFAGIVALLNELAVVKSGKPLGFLNPLLYQIWAQQPNAFQDITVGDNKCTETGCKLTCEGFYAAPGWDPVSGLGTPNYPILSSAVSQILDQNMNSAQPSLRGTGGVETVASA